MPDNFGCYSDIFPPERFSKLCGAKSYPSEKLSPKSHFLLRHFLTFSIIARIIYALMCQTCYIRYHKIYSAKFKQKRKRIFFVDYILVPKKRFQVKTFITYPHIVRKSQKLCLKHLLTFSIIAGIVYA